MRAISNLTVLLYSICFFLIGAALLLIASNVISKDVLAYNVEFLYANQDVRWIMGGLGALLVIVALSAVQIMLGRMQMERTIAFDNPNGQVTISLGAIEDFIKRLTRQLPEIKELKPTVIATKKGVDVSMRLVLYSATNIPELTEKIQGIIKEKVQEILGIEEAIFVKIHISKIASKEEPREVKIKDKEAVPFRGIEY